MTITPKAIIHKGAVVDNGAAIGDGTKVWGFTHIMGGAKIGTHCNICEQVFIENDVIVGDRVIIKCGVQLWDGLRIEDDVFIGPNVTFTNDKYPPSAHWPIDMLMTIVKTGASIGGGAVILPGITIGEKAIVGAGSVVTRSVPTKAVVMGNPARVVRYLTQ